MTPPVQPTPRIFVSHSHVDNEFGVKLVRDLRRVLGDDNAVWYDEAGGLHGGAPWWDKIMLELIARNIFIVVLSPDAMQSVWVRREINIAINKNKTIIPLLYRECEVRPDIEILQMISFLPPKAPEDAFDELLVALGLETSAGTEKSGNQMYDPDAALVQQMMSQIEAAFNEQDWPSVIRKVEYLLKRVPASVTADIFRMQGNALYEEGEVQPAQEAFDVALALVSERSLRLTILHDYTTMLIAQGQWARVLRYVKEALRLAPNDQHWLATQEKAQDKLTPAKPPVVEEQTPIEAVPKQRAERPSQKMVEQRLKKGDIQQDAATYEGKEKTDEVFRKSQKPPPSVWEASVFIGLITVPILLGIYIDSVAHTRPFFGLLGLLFSLVYGVCGASRLSRIDVLSKTKEQWVAEGNAHYNAGRHGKAIAAYGRAIARDPTYADAYYSRGNAYLDLKRYRRALQEFDEALRLDSKYTLAYVNRGQIYRILNQYRQALQDFDRAIELDKGCASAYSGRGRVYVAFKLYWRAIEDFDRALELDPGLDWVKTEREEARRLSGRK